MRKRILKIFILVYLLFLTALISSWAVLHVYEANGRYFDHRIGHAVIFFASIPSKIKFFITNLYYDKPQNIEGQLIMNKDLSDGFTLYDTTLTRQLYGFNILVSTYNSKFQYNEIKLIDLNTLKLKKKWVIYDTSLFNKRKRSARFSLLLHPLIFEGKFLLVGDYPYLIKVDNNANILWNKPLFVHHSMELDADNNLWVCGKSDYNLNYISTDSLYSDAIMKINPNTGQLLYKKSIFSILHDNGYSYLLSIGLYDGDPIHVNDIQPAYNSTRYWQKGDLLISLRHRNTIFLYRPSTQKIIWLKVGPWSNQHDCDFIDSSKILVFGNDIIRFRFELKFINGYNNAYVYDLAKETVSTPFSNFFITSKISTAKEGLSDILPNNHLFVEETCNGRLLIGDTNKVKLIYVERENNNYIKRFNWSRIVRDDEISGLKLIQ